MTLRLAASAIGAAALAGLLAAAPVQAQEPPDTEAWVHEDGPRAYRSIAFTVENDVFAGTDRNYTNGLRLAVTSLPRVLSGAETVTDWVAQNLMFTDDNDFLRREFALGHSIFTPEDRLASEPLPDEHPYAGWLYLEASALVLRPSIEALDTFTIQAGIVGPAAGGEFVQNNFHDLIGDDQLQGWDNQLENEPGIALSFNRKYRQPLLEPDTGRGLEIDFVPSAGATVGNVLTMASLGGVLRVGVDLDQTFGPPRVRPALGGSAIFESQERVSGYAFFGAEGRAVAQNIFLDGNTFQDSLSVDKYPLVGDVQAGFVLQYRDWMLSWSAVARTKEFKTQSERQRFGAISIAKRF